MELEERLATAAELVGGRREARFDRLQIRDAVNRAQAVPGVWLAIDRRSRRDALVACVSGLIALASMVLVPGLPRPIAVPNDHPAVPVDLASPDESSQRTLPADVPDLAANAAERLQVAPPIADLASRVQQEQAERSALDSLAQALGNVSASRSAANAIQQGDFGAASDQLQNLGDNADQLSEAAKQQLSRALQESAAATTQASANPGRLTAPLRLPSRRAGPASRDAPGEANRILHSEARA